MLLKNGIKLMIFQEPTTTQDHQMKHFQKLWNTDKTLKLNFDLFIFIMNLNLLIKNIAHGWV
jgi:hypothetical protein